MDQSDPSVTFNLLGPPRPAAEPATYKKTRYHHGELVVTALRRGMEIVARHGPQALTLRGLARELGVTAPALSHHFGSVATLRAAVAQAVLAEAAKASGFAPGAFARRSPEEVGRAWARFAADNPNLYRLASGEGWRGSGPLLNGYSGGALAVPSPWRALEAGLRQQARGAAAPVDSDVARYLAYSVHGLALARVDGVPEAAVEEGLTRTADSARRPVG